MIAKQKVILSQWTQLNIRMKYNILFQTILFMFNFLQKLVSFVSVSLLPIVGAFCERNFPLIAKWKIKKINKLNENCNPDTQSEWRIVSLLISLTMCSFGREAEGICFVSMSVLCYKFRRFCFIPNQIETKQWKNKIGPN